MEDLKNNEVQNAYWSHRYRESNTGWDVGYATQPLKSYIDQLENKQLKILIPGAGNAYEAEYLFNHGFKNVFVLDIALEPLQELKNRLPNFPDSHIIQGNFFEHKMKYDLIFEQTFFCSFVPTKKNRNLYANQMFNLLKSGGKLVGLWFTFPLEANSDKRPFGGSRDEYLSYLNPYFDTIIFESCYNSIPPRSGNELFGIFRKKES